MRFAPTQVPSPTPHPAEPPHDWHSQMEEALNQLRRWREGFATADPDSIDYCIYQMQAAEERVAWVIRQARRSFGTSVTSALPVPPHAIGAESSSAQS